MTCDDCQYFQSIETPENLPIKQRVGECRIQPPRITSSAPAHSDRSRAVFPLVRDSDWCGAFVSSVNESAHASAHVRNAEANAAFDSASHHDATDGLVTASACGCDRRPE